MYQAVLEAVAASLAGAMLDSLDSRNYQEDLHRGVGSPCMKIAAESYALLQGYLGTRRRVCPDCTAKY